MHMKRVLMAGTAGAALAAGGCGGSASAGRPAAAPAPAARTAVVPNLEGVEQGKARALAQRNGLQMRWTGFVGRLANGHTNVRCVKVFRQSPVAGERRAPGASIAVLEIACHTPTGRWHDAAGVDE
jgi:hypothetical protein